MRKKLKLGLGILLLGAGCFSASAQAGQTQPEAQTQTETPDALPSFLPKDYKVTDTLWGEWGLRMNTDHFEGAPSYPELEFNSGKSEIYFWPSLFRGKWEIAHNVPFKFKTLGAVNVQKVEGFVCRGENLKLWFDNGDFAPLEDSKHNGCKRSNSEHDAYGEASDGNAAEIKDSVEPVEMYKLSDLINSHKPVAVTQGKNVLLIKSEDESAIKEYQDQINPKIHPAFLPQVKRYSDSQKE